MAVHNSVGMQCSIDANREAVASPFVLTNTTPVSGGAGLSVIAAGWPEWSPIPEHVTAAANVC
jgi:hypothetical protein